MAIDIFANFKDKPEIGDFPLVFTETSENFPLFPGALLSLCMVAGVNRI